jgi:hypothetical protein
MLTKSWRRSRRSVIGALALILGIPMLAEAQQGGLFPLAPIRRQRVPCPAEDPVYGLYRREYFGYHPTCWRPFPVGWGCPSPEAPDAAAAFRALPRDKPNVQTGGPEGDLGPDEGPDRGMGPGETAPPEGGNLPAVPRGGRSPFEPDTDRGDRMPAPETPPPPGGAGPAAPPGNGASLLELPPVGDAPAPKPATPGPARVISRAEAPPTAAEPENAPLLALPEPTAPISSNAAQPPASSLPPAAPALDPGPSASNTFPPAQAPRRTSLLGGLFGRFNRTRQ